MRRLRAPTSRSAQRTAHWAVSGAFTGEISAEMLKACGVEYVITGHSERRTYFGDTDVTVQKRTRAALDAGLTVIVCVGEYLEQREPRASPMSSLPCRQRSHSAA